METKLDKFGRIVIPKKVRDNLGLEPGDQLAIEEVERGILLKPADEDSRLVVKDGVLVFRGTIEGDIVEHIRSLREERSKNLLRDVTE